MDHIILDAFRLVGVWVNAPSTSQPHHTHHGCRGVAAFPRRGPTPDRVAFGYYDADGGFNSLKIDPRLLSASHLQRP